MTQQTATRTATFSATTSWVGVVLLGAGTSTLLITDSSGAHPSVIIHVTSAAGSPTFEGGVSMYTPLVDGDRSPTLYLLPGDAADFTMDITVGIIDADPCSASVASSFAVSQAGVFGAVWESMTSCAMPATWSITADGEPSAPLTMAFADRYQTPTAPTTREVELTGLPEGVSWERASDTGGLLRVTLSATTAVEPGTYPLAWSAIDRSETDGTVTLSRASSSSATLSVMAAPPPPAVEEPLATPDPPSSSTPAAPTSDSPPAEVTIAPVPSEPALVRTPVEQSFDIPVVLPPVTESTPEIPEPPSKERVPRSVGEVGSRIPEPLGAGVWLGVGTGVLAGGGILAALRRRFARTRSTAVDSSGRID